MYQRRHPEIVILEYIKNTFSYTETPFYKMRFFVIGFALAIGVVSASQDFNMPLEHVTTLNNQPFYLIEFASNMCGSCKVFEPTFKKLAAKL